MTSPSKQQGFTLIEIMVSVSLGMILLMGITTVFQNTSVSVRQNELIASLQQSGRFALDTISNDIQNGAFVAGIVNLDEVRYGDTSLALATDCGKAAETKWALNLSDAYGGAIEFLSQQTAATVNTEHTCIPSTDLFTKSDVLTIKRTTGQAVDSTGTLTPNTVYIRSNLEFGCIWFYNGSNAPTHADCPASGMLMDFPYVNNVYYIRKYAETPGDGIPSLCRYRLGYDTTAASPSMINECLAEGVEDYRVEWGIDTDTPLDGQANQYVRAPTAAQMERAISAKIFVLTRSSNEDKAKPAVSKTFYLGTERPAPTDITVTKNDRYYRRVYSTTVLLRNVANRAGFE